MNRRHFLSLAGLALATGAAGLLRPRPVSAHHGWGWATDEEFELTGSIKTVHLGNPHGEMALDVNGQEWMVEIGQPWRNSRAGLTPEILSAGTEVTVHGHRSNDPDQRVMKAERLVIAGRDYNLYPDRAS